MHQGSRELAGLRAGKMIARGTPATRPERRDVRRSITGSLETELDATAWVTTRALTVRFGGSYDVRTDALLIVAVLPARR